MICQHNKPNWCEQCEEEEKLVSPEAISPSELNRLLEENPDGVVYRGELVKRKDGFYQVRDQYFESLWGEVLQHIGRLVKWKAA